MSTTDTPAENNTRDFVLCIFVTALVMAGMIALGASLGPKRYGNQSRVPVEAASPPAVGVNPL